MEAAMVEMSASEPRERLLAFVDEVVRPLPHVRQRENALLYVRGLIEQGGRKSLQPTLFRLEESPARYESMQQFLADSPWDPELLVRACAERVAPEIGVTAWVVDDTGIVKDGKHSPGVKRQYSGTLGKIGNCQIAVSAARGRRAGDAAAGLRALSARGVVRRSASGAGRRRSPTGSSSRRSRSWRRRWPSRRPAGSCRRRRSSPTAPTATTPPSAPACTRSSSSTCSPSPPRSASTGRRRPSRCPSATAASGGGGRSPGPTANPSRCVRSPSDCRGAPGRRCPAARHRRARTSTSRFAFVRVVATHPVRTDCLPPREEWLIIEWPEGKDAPSDYWLSNLPADTTRERLDPKSPARA